jgi:LmbE family N-acetylglucosaminyl deacetylase
MPKDKQPDHPAAADLALAAVEAAAVKKQTKPRGPKPGTIRRYTDDDHTFIPKVYELMKEQNMTLSAACTHIGPQLGGYGTPENRGKRLAQLIRDLEAEAAEAKAKANRRRGRPVPRQN